CTWILFFLLLFVFPGVVTVTVSQGSDAILPCSPTPKENLSFKSFKWRKDGQNVFYYDAGNHYNNGLRGQDPQFKDRVSFFQDQLRSGNASIQIQNVTIQDSGIYSCEISGLNSGSQTFNIKLVVSKYLTFVIILKDKNQYLNSTFYIYFLHDPFDFYLSMTPLASPGNRLTEKGAKGRIPPASVYFTTLELICRL
uniref:Ig-like domain-containing protein n=1 Tax=Poecilia mexicana TaxID=48701 RepID=A0A3B3XVG7_9TELE